MSRAFRCASIWISAGLVLAAIGSPALAGDRHGATPGDEEYDSTRYGYEARRDVGSVDVERFGYDQRPTVATAAVEWFPANDDSVDPCVVVHARAGEACPRAQAVYSRPRWIERPPPMEAPEYEPEMAEVVGQSLPGGFFAGGGGVGPSFGGYGYGDESVHVFAGGSGQASANASANASASAQAAITVSVSGMIGGGKGWGGGGWGGASGGSWGGGSGHPWGSHGPSKSHGGWGK